MDVETSRTMALGRNGNSFLGSLPQVLAMGAANCAVMNIGVTILFSAIIIADLHNSQEELSMDDELVSWFGGLPYMIQPIGSIASGFLVMWLGRKRSLILITVPHLLSCLLMSTANSIAVLFFTNILIGLTTGLTEAPVNTYSGEVCQPKMRSFLASSAALFYQIGMASTLYLGSLMHWRAATAVSAALPVLTMLLLSQIPESPIWLVANGKIKQAEASLCWLRGWVRPSAVQHELEELVFYHENVTMKHIGKTRHKKRENGHSLDQNSLSVCEDLTITKQENDSNTGDKEMENMVGDARAIQEVEGDEEESEFCVKANLLLEPETCRPLVMTLLFFTFSGLGGMAAVRPYIVEVLHRFHCPMDPKKGSVIVSVSGLLGSIFLMAVVRFSGKRRLAMVSTVACAASCLLLALYAYLAIEPARQTGDHSYLVATWLPLAFFAVLAFSSAVQGQIPWILLVEVFPYRTRGVASGLAAGSVYLVSFIASKTYLDTEHGLRLYGAFLLFGSVSCICFVYLFLQLPETEGKSLQEIERLFAGNKLDNDRAYPASNSNRNTSSDVL